MLYLLKYEILFVLIASKLILIKSISSNRNFCSNTNINLIGIKAVCENSISGTKVSCLDPIKPKTKVLISCHYGYFNKQKINEQEIECNSLGEWSELPMKCDDICNGIPNNFDLGFGEPWFIKMNIKKENEKFCQAMILNAQLLLAKSSCVKSYRSNDFLINIKDPVPQNLEIKQIYYNDSDEISIIELKNYITYNERARPACTNLTVENEEKFILDLERFKKQRIGIVDSNSYKTETCSFKYFEDQLNAKNNINYECFVEDRRISCNGDLEKGTLIKFYCKLGNNIVFSNGPNETRCGLEGKWDQEVIPQCLNSYTDQCGQYGLRTPNKLPLLANAGPIEIYNAPWHIAIYKNLTQDYQQICGGTLIQSNIVITAGHCFDNIAQNQLDPEWKFIVASGKTYRNFNSAESTTQFSRIKKIHVPNIYNVNDERHDIAVVVLEDHLQFNDFTGPACIKWSSYSEYNIQPGKEGLVVGWGATSATENFSEELLSIKLTILNNQQCKNLAHPNHRKQITGEKFCALGYNSASACKGDSGGGFLIKNDDDRYYLWGVVSYGIDPAKHCTPNFLTTYTNIQYHQDFIKDVIQNNK